MLQCREKIINFLSTAIDCTIEQLAALFSLTKLLIIRFFSRQTPRTIDDTKKHLCSAACATTDKS